MIIKNNALIKFKAIATNLLLVSVLLELIFYWSLNNFIACFVLLYGWYLLKYFVLTSNIMRLYPISFLMILGLSIFHYILPIPLTFIEFKPVTYNMDVPLLTFGHHLLFVTMIVIAHLLYTNISNGKNIFRNLLKNTKFYIKPTTKQIWITACLGLFFSYYKYFIYGNWQSDVSERNFIFYIASIFSQFIWMPLIIPFIKDRNRINLKKSRYENVTIIVYSFFVVVIAIASNVRTILFNGVFIIISVYLIFIFFGYYNYKKQFNTKNIIVSIFLGFLIIGPLIDFSYAMVVTRQSKYELSTTDLLKETLRIYNEKEKMNNQKEFDLYVKNGNIGLVKKWNEDYLSNNILNRFCNLKISDACLYHAQNIGYGNYKMQHEFRNQLLALLPNAFIGYFGVNLTDKFETASYSITDYLYSLSINDPNVKGSFIIGSVPGVGMAIFGFWYLLIIIPLFAILFAMFDSFVFIKKGQLFFSYFFFIMIFTVINYFNDRHVFQFEFRFILRGYFENIITFLIIMSFMRLIAPSSKKRIKT